MTDARRIAKTVQKWHRPLRRALSAAFVTLLSFAFPRYRTMFSFPEYPVNERSVYVPGKTFLVRPCRLLSTPDGRM